MTDRKKIYMAIGIAAALMLISKKGKAAPAAGKVKVNVEDLLIKYGADRVQKFADVLQALYKIGLRDLQLKLLASQVAHETGFFTSASNVARLNNNYSGISWINKPSIQKNASKGSAFPSREGNYYYAHFDTIADWANDYIRILNKRPGLPLQASTPADLAHRLKQNKYYTANEASYAKGLTNFYNRINI